MKKRALADVPKWLALSKTLEHYNSDVSNSCRKANLTGARKREPCVKKTSVELGFFTLRLRRRILRLFGDFSQTEPKYPQEQ